MSLRLDPTNPDHLKILNRINKKTGKSYLEEARQAAVAPKPNRILEALDKTAPTPSDASEKRRPKYGNKKHQVDGVWFDSVWESHCYLILKELEQRKVIYDLKLQVPYKFYFNEMEIWGCVLDFEFKVLIQGKYETVSADAKSAPTINNRIWRTHVKMMKAFFNRDIKIFIKNQTDIQAEIKKLTQRFT